MSANDWENDEIASKDDVFEFKGNRERLRSDSRESLPNRKRTKPNHKKETDKPSKPVKKPLELETDPDVLQRRQKQIDYGKNTVGYHSYTQQVPYDQRTKDDPKTPDKYCKYSRRSWDMLIKMWRKSLHKYDTDGDNAESNKDGDSDGGNAGSNKDGDSDV